MASGNNEMSRRRFMRTSVSAAALAGLAGPAAHAFGMTSGAGGSGYQRPRRLRLPPEMNWSRPLLILWRPGVFVTYSMQLPKIKFPPNQFFVSASGNDSDDGSISSPLRTLIEARNRLHQVGGGEVFLDGSEIEGWGNIPTGVPIRIVGNGSSIVLPLPPSESPRVLRFGADFHLSDLTAEGEIVTVGEGLVGIYNDCVFRNSQNNGIDHNGIGNEFYVIRCEAYGNQGDGFGFAGNNQVFEAYNYSHDNGDSGPASSDQGSSNHGTVRSVRLGCEYRNNNFNILDINTEGNFIVECVGEGSPHYSGSNLGVWGNAVTWAYGGSFLGGAQWDISVGPNGVLYTTLDLSNYKIRPDSDVRPL